MKESKLYSFLKPIISILVRIVFRPKYKGLKNIKESGGVILAGNHTSIFDSVLLVSASKRNIHFFAKDTLAKGPLKIIFKNMGLINVDRSKKNPESILQAKEYLEHEKVVLIFPEGTTEKGRGLLPFKVGAVKIAKDTNIEITPFVIKGKYNIFKRIEIEFLEPIKIKGDIIKENDRLRDLIKSSLEG